MSAVWLITAAVAATGPSALRASDSRSSSRSGRCKNSSTLPSKTFRPCRTTSTWSSESSSALGGWCSVSTQHIEKRRQSARRSASSCPPAPVDSTLHASSSSSTRGDVASAAAICTRRRWPEVRAPRRSSATCSSRSADSRKLHHASTDGWPCSCRSGVHRAARRMLSRTVSTASYGSSCAT